MLRVVTNTLPLRIFLASPGDLEDERSAIQACVDEHTSRREDADNVTYEVVGWDRVRGTVRRPQEAINELIEECHFMIVLFKGTWGSEPGSPWAYTSGTEEELFTGLLELGQADQPMRDIWVAFVEHPNPNERIVKLRKQIIDRHSLMFESISGSSDLKAKLTDRLKTWESLAGTKRPVHIDLLSSSGKDVLQAANLRLQGEKLVELGQPLAGQTALKEAAALGGPVEQLAYGKFLRRAGDLEGALAFTQKAIDFLVEAGPLYSPLAADAFSAQARVLGAQGRQPDAIGRLEHALTLVRSDDPHARAVRCRILDDLGIAHRKVKDLPAARKRFEEALELRREYKREIDVCQSLINIARLEVESGDLDTAATYADEVMETLRDTPPSGLHANAEVLVAQVRLRQGKPDEGIPHAEKALAVNRQIANRPGEAISFLILAQCSRAAGLHTEAEEYAQACLAVNRSMGNRGGEQKAQWFLDNMDE